LLGWITVEQPFGRMLWVTKWKLDTRGLPIAETVPGFFDPAHKSNGCDWM
jgi:hypothetical protein